MWGWDYVGGSWQAKQNQPAAICTARSAGNAAELQGMRAQRKAPSTPSTLKCSHVEGGLTTNKLANDPHIICGVTYPNVLLA